MPFIDLRTISPLPVKRGRKMKVEFVEVPIGDGDDETDLKDLQEVKPYHIARWYIKSPSGYTESGRSIYEDNPQPYERARHGLSSFSDSKLDIFMRNIESTFDQLNRQINGSPSTWAKVGLLRLLREE